MIVIKYNGFWLLFLFWQSICFAQETVCKAPVFSFKLLALCDIKIKKQSDIKVEKKHIKNN
jgi:hypothetical protein